MDNRILQLAMEALQARRAEIQLEIEALQLMLKGKEVSGATAPAAAGRFHRTAAQRKAHSVRMKRIWRLRKAAAGNRPASAKAPAKPKTGPQTAAARKAQSERMKAYWAKRKAEAAKKR